MKKYYCVLRIETAIDIENYKSFFPGSVKLSWADGMIGALPVFSNKRKAERYAKPDKGQVVVVFKINKETK